MPEEDRDGHLRVDKAIQGRGGSARLGGTKTGDASLLPVYADDLEAWIQWRLRQASGPGFALFPNPRARNAQKRWTIDAMEATWNRAARAVGVRARLYEGTKHTMATGLVRQGVPLEVVQVLLRHRDIRTTEIYAKLGMEAAVKLLRGGLVGGWAGIGEKNRSWYS